MIEIDADVLLIDEVLAVGDAAFQQKCFDEFEKIRASNRTVLLVTHDMGAVQRFCDEGILLEHGQIVATGDPQTVGDRYLDLNFSEAARAQAAAGGEQEDGPSSSLGDGRAVIERTWFEQASGGEGATLPNGAKTTFAMEVRFTSPVENPLFSVTMRNSSAVPLLSASSGWGCEPVGTIQAGETVVWKATFDNLLGPDRYTVTPTVTLSGGAVLALREDIPTVVVTRSAPTGALVDIPFEQVLERGGSANQQPELTK
jgi:hypothetical protein